MLDAEGKVIDHSEILTTKDALNNLLDNYNDHDVHYAFEAGNMAYFVHDIVEKRENTARIHVVHPKKFKIISESKHKNDRQDSKKLAMALLKDYLPYPVYIKSVHSRELRLLLNIRKRKVGSRTRIILQTKSIIRSMGMQTKTASLRSERGFQRILDALTPERNEYAIIKLLKDDFSREHREIQDIEESIQLKIKQSFSREYELLTSIPGIGFITAATILSVVDTIDRFDNAGQFSAYCGLVPSERSSGDRIIHGKITKEGTKDTRTLLIQAAWVAMGYHKKDDARMKSLYKKFTRISVKEKNAQKAIVAVARHLSRIIFGVLKHNCVYLPEITQGIKSV